jgi:hypothetical protein
MKWMKLLLPVAGMAALAACAAEEQPGVCDAEDRDEPWVAGLLAEGEQGLLATTLDAVDPEPPGLGANAWTLTVLDGDDAPVDGCDLLAVPWMPDHGHGSSESTATAAAEPGAYLVEEIDVTMVGYWTFGIELDCAGDEDRVEYRLCIDG